MVSWSVSTLKGKLVRNCAQVGWAGMPTCIPMMALGRQSHPFDSLSAPSLTPNAVRPSPFSRHLIRAIHLGGYEVSAHKIRCDSTFNQRSHHTYLHFLFTPLKTTPHERH